MHSSCKKTIDLVSWFLTAIELTFIAGLSLPVSYKPAVVMPVGSALSISCLNGQWYWDHDRRFLSLLIFGLEPIVILGHYCRLLLESAMMLSVPVWETEPTVIDYTNNFITLSYDVQWRQTLYQSYITRRDLQLCISWHHFLEVVLMPKHLIHKII
jgi:hypothetical protein